MTISIILLVLPALVGCEMTEEAKNQILDLHNKHRGNLGASNMFKLKWDDELQKQSEEWANRCVFEHKGRGENLAWNKPMNPMTTEELIDVAFKDWYDEKNQHSYGSGRCANTMSCHYTQLAWHNTTDIGCAFKNCSYLVNGAANAWWIVCNYLPWGNTVGDKVFEKGAACSHEDCEGLPCEEGLCVGEMKPARNKCEDKNTSCKQWAKANQCEVNSSYMKADCPKSCGVCKAEEGEFEVEECADDDEKCAKWASERQCSVNPNFMLVKCKKSCNQC